MKQKEKNSPKQLVPALRFPEFANAGDWIEKKIGDIGEVITGTTPNTQKKEYYGGEKLFVSPADIDESRFIFKTKTTLTELGFIQTRSIPKNSTLFVCIGSTIGKVAQNLVECASNQQINAVAPYSDFDSTFNYYILDLYSANISKLAGRHAVPIINKSKFSAVTLLIPSLPEQQKIADCLSSLDEVISLESQKLQSLQSYKKGLLQSLFPAEGETVPKLRFPEFKDAGDWEEVGGDILFDPITNKNHDSSLPILAITQEHGAIPRHLIDYQISVTEKSIESYKVVEPGDFIISLRSFQGGIEYSNYLGICSPAYIILRKKRDLSNHFYRYYFKTTKYIQDLNKNIEGIRDGKMVSFKQFSDIQIPFPSLPEQEKIVDCLSSVDALIQEQSERVEGLKAHKKGLLQGLFPVMGE